MRITKNGVRLLVDDIDAERIVLERLNGPEIYLPAAEIILDTDPPRIGEEWSAQGGTYAGIGVRGDEQGHLIIGPEYEGGIDWDGAVKWAAGLRVGELADFLLPWRKAQALCFANVAQLFQKEAYWSSEQHASDSGNAWGQYFDDGRQDYWFKLSKLRARAVRWLPIC